MNTKFLASALIAAVGFAAAPSFANDLYGGEVGLLPQVSASTSGLTRAQVQNEVLQAMRNHELPTVGEVGDVRVVATGSDRTRAEVREDYLQAKRNHELTSFGEGAEQGVVAVSPRSGLTREAVHAEAVRALREHRIVNGEV